MRHPFLIGVWNSHKKTLQHKADAANIIANKKNRKFYG